MPLESEGIGCWHAAQRLHYHIQGAPRIYGFVDHRPFSEMYQRKPISKLSLQMFKLLNELLEYTFIMEYTPGKEHLIAAVDTLRRASTEDITTLSQDPLDLEFHLLNRDPTESKAHR